MDGRGFVRTRYNLTPMISPSRLHHQSVPQGQHISDKALDEFIAIYREEFAEDISRAAAGEMASRLLTLYELLARKLPNDKISHPKPRGEDEQVHPKIGFRA